MSDNILIKCTECDWTHETNDHVEAWNKQVNHRKETEHRAIKERQESDD